MLDITQITIQRKCKRQVYSMKGIYYSFIVVVVHGNNCKGIFEENDGFSVNFMFNL